MKIINIFIVLVVLLVVLSIGSYMSVYVVGEEQQVVVTRFGKIIGEPVKKPGLFFKFPVVDIPNYFPKNIQTWDGDPGQIPTLDKTYIWVDTFAQWQIVDPIKFFQTVRNVETALSRLDDLIDPAVRNFITSYSLIEAVRKSNRNLLFDKEFGADEHFDVPEESAKSNKAVYKIKKGREKIAKMILNQAQPKLVEFGIKLFDVKIKRVNYVEEVRKSVYGRMIAERQQIAEKFRSEGAGEARKILGGKERELKRITSEAYKKAQIIKGKADAEVTDILAKAFSIDPEFYSFVKTLEIYKNSLGARTSVVFSTDSEFFKYMKNYKLE